MEGFEFQTKKLELYFGDIWKILTDVGKNCGMTVSVILMKNNLEVLLKMTWNSQKLEVGRLVENLIK